ncbi:MAG TPA: CerR family C-terminal domain-containing protein [Pirellulales bacterium]|jgi:AcrR family transcriptional regulator|nr:CerR family C-terminal domain-containing protein [Pirellulales bacterium]
MTTDTASHSLSADTRERLLAAAGQIFAEKGFKDATVREICARAGVNLAAVNYHFGDKEHLYAELVKAAHRLRVERAPLPGWDESKPPEQKLREFVRTLLVRLLDDPAPPWHVQLMLREMAQPTGACAALVRDYIEPDFKLLLRIIDALVPADLPIARRRLIAFSVVGQCLHYRVAQPVIALLVPPEECRNLTSDQLADHISRFTLAALAQLSGEDRGAA